MTPFRTLLLALACTATLAGCQSSRVVTDYDQSVDFSQYRQYSWLDERSGASEQFDPLLAKRVRDAVSSELQARGLGENATEADFLVRFFVASSAAVSEPKMRVAGLPARRNPRQAGGRGGDRLSRPAEPGADLARARAGHAER
jgi:hypothetical protein